MNLRNCLKCIFSLNGEGAGMLRLLFIGTLFLKFNFCDGQFTLYNSIHYPGIPSTYNYSGNSGNYVPYLKGFILDYGAATGGSNGGGCTPDASNIQQYSTEALNNPSWPVSFDMEINWPTSGQALTDSVNNYISAVNIFKSTNTQSPVSFYGLPPYPNAWRWSGVSGSSTFENVSKSAAFVSLANVVDYFSPSLYAYSTDDTVTWRKYADTMVNAIRKYYSTTKPIYPYIWPQWHDNGNQLIDTATWNYQLNYLYKITQGAIIWTGGTYNWDGNAPWWRTTKKFMAQKGLIAPVVVDSFYTKESSLAGNTTLRWITSTDTVTQYFQVEKSTDNINYTPLSGEINRNGDYYSMNAYEFTDTTANYTTIYYRLKSVAPSGTRYLDTIQGAILKSAGTGVNVDLSSSSGWLKNVSDAWVTADTTPASLHDGLIILSPNDTWQNTLAASVIEPGVTIIDSALSGTFSTTDLLHNSGKIVFCKNALQTIPGSSSLYGSSWGDIEINNSNGVTSTQSGASSFMHVGKLTLTSGTFTVTASGGKSVSLYLDSTVNVANGNLTVTNAATNYGIFINGKSTQNFSNGTFLDNTVYALNITNPAGFRYDGSLIVSHTLKLSHSTTMSVSGDLSFNGLSIDTITTIPQIQSGGDAIVSGVLSISKFGITPYIGQEYILVKSLNGITGGFSSTSLPSGYAGTVVIKNNNLVLTITSVPKAYKSAGTNVSVDLSSASNWLTYTNGNWALASTAPSALDSGSILIQQGDIWNNASAVVLPASVSIVQQGSTGTFSTTQTLNLLNTSLVYSGTTVQTIPAPTAFVNRSVNNLTIDNPTTVTLNPGSYLNVYGTLSLNAGNFTTNGGSGLYIYGQLLRTGGHITFPGIGFCGSAAQTIPDSTVTNSILYIKNPAGVSALPNITLNVTTLNLQSGNLVLSNNDSLKISGVINYTSGGVVSTPSSVTELTAAVSQFLPENTFTDNTVNNLVINNAKGISAAGSLSISGLSVNKLDSITPLQITGNAVLSGVLNIDSIIQTANQTDTIIAAALVSGTFSALNLPDGYTGSLTYTPTAVILNIAEQNPLVIQRIALTGKNVMNAISLTWSANSSNVRYFEVQHSIDGVHFTTSSQVNAATNNSRYHYMDNSISAKNYYRLKITGNNGTTYQSNTVNINLTVKKDMAVYPNPVNGQTVTITYSPLIANTRVSIINMNDKTVLVENASKGSVQKTLNVAALPAGIYFIVISEADTDRKKSIKLIRR